MFSTLINWPSKHQDYTEPVKIKLIDVVLSSLSSSSTQHSNQRDQIWGQDVFSWLYSKMQFSLLNTDPIVVHVVHFHLLNSFCRNNIFNMWPSYKGIWTNVRYYPVYTFVMCIECSHIRCTEIVYKLYIQVWRQRWTTHVNRGVYRTVELVHGNMPHHHLKW